MKNLVFLGVIAVALGAPHDIREAHTHAGLVAPTAYAGHGLIAGHGLAHSGVVGYSAAQVGVQHHVIQPAAQQYAVALPPKEVKVPITKQHVTVPIHQKTHYGTQTYVAGSSTSIHKPALSAPAIAPPSVLLSKVSHNAPEVTVKTQEVKVEKNIPNFVDTPFHAGTIVKYTQPEITEVKVPHPVAKPVAVPVQVPYAQPVAHPVPVPVHAGTQYHHHAVAPVHTGAVAHHAVAPVHTGAVSAYAGHGLTGLGLTGYTGAVAPTAYARHGLLAGHGLVGGHGLTGYTGFSGYTGLPVVPAVAEE